MINPPRIYRRECRQCGRAFETESPYTFLCSDECKADRARELSRKSKAFQRQGGVETVCVVCGETFKRKSVTRKYCSERCRSIARSSKFNATLTREEMCELFADLGKKEAAPKRTLEELVAESNKRHISYGKLQGEIYAREH